MHRNTIRKKLSFLLILVMMAGMCCAAEAQDGITVQEHLEEKALELGKRYGYMSIGAETFPEKNDMADILFPEDVAAHDHGILFTDIHDYDGDGAPELLVFRRQEGYANYRYSTGILIGVARSEYLFEMYEYSEMGNCLLSSRFVAGAADVFNIFSSHTATTVFRRDHDGQVELFMETIVSGQDHPEDICLLKIRYENGKFCNHSAIRYGGLFWGEDNVRYLEAKSADAFDLMCYSGTAREDYWDLKASSNTYDESFKNVLKEGLANYGLTLLTTRYDAQMEINRKNKASESLDEVKDPEVYSALDCYGPDSGELTPLAFTCLYRANKGLELVRAVYTEDPAGAERPAPAKG